MGQIFIFDFLLFEGQLRHCCFTFFYNNTVCTVKCRIEPLHALYRSCLVLELNWPFCSITFNYFYQNNLSSMR